MQKGFVNGWSTMGHQIFTYLLHEFSIIILDLPQLFQLECTEKHVHQVLADIVLQNFLLRSRKALDWTNAFERGHQDEAQGIIDAVKFETVNINIDGVNAIGGLFGRVHCRDWIGTVRVGVSINIDLDCNLRGGEDSAWEVGCGKWEEEVRINMRIVKESCRAGRCESCTYEGSSFVENPRVLGYQSNPLIMNTYITC